MRVSIKRTDRQLSAKRRKHRGSGVDRHADKAEYFLTNGASDIVIVFFEQEELSRTQKQIEKAWALDQIAPQFATFPQNSAGLRSVCDA